MKLSAIIFSVFVAFSGSREALAADQWPTRPVTIICPFPAGISTDILTRAVASALSERFGQQFVVENRAGATGNIGAGAAARAPADGYTLLVSTLGPAVANKYMYKNLSYDPEKAFEPIVLIGSSPLIIVGSPTIPANNLAELIAHAKKNPGKLNGATVGHGSQAHITLELINKLAGIAIVHVPYRTTPQALPDLISGDIQVGFNYIPTFVPAVQENVIRGLAVTSLTRLKDLPDVPTVAETGFPGFEASGWNALLAPAGTPPDIIAQLNQAVNGYLESDRGRIQLQRIGMTIGGGSPDDLKRHLAGERAKWAPIIKDANITLQ